MCILYFWYEVSLLFQISNKNLKEFQKNYAYGDYMIKKIVIQEAKLSLFRLAWEILRNVTLAQMFWEKKKKKEEKFSFLSYPIATSIHILHFISRGPPEKILVWQRSWRGAISANICNNPVTHLFPKTPSVCGKSVFCPNSRCSRDG